VRVLHVINGEHYSGAERVQDLLAANLPQAGFDVSFACLKPDKFASARKCESATLYELPMRSRFDVRVVWQLWKIVRREGYALLHAHTPRSLLAARAVAWLADVPIVYHVHSPTSRDTTHAWRNRLNHWTEKFSLTGVRAMIAVSGSLRRHMLNQGYADDIVFRVANGVPVPAVVRDESVPGPVWELGMSALFRPRKGLEILLEAMAVLRSRDVPIRLRAIGAFETAAYEQEIKKRAADLGVDDAIVWTSAKDCRWLCWKPWRREFRLWPRMSKAFRKRLRTGSMAFSPRRPTARTWR
jgi:glycosyltransferase involved in cell wall biosynthesis